MYLQQRQLSLLYLRRLLYEGDQQLQEWPRCRTLSLLLFFLLYYNDVPVFVFSLERRFVAQERNNQNSAAENKRYILGIPEQPRISRSS